MVGCRLRQGVAPEPHDESAGRLLTLRTAGRALSDQRLPDAKLRQLAPLHVALTPVDNTRRRSQQRIKSLLRELRGDLHIHAASALRLTPLEAILGKDGPARAHELFYPEPYPNPETFMNRRRDAEELTDALCADFYAVLAPDEAHQLLDLLRKARLLLDHDVASKPLHT